jgi:CelD/BcsL family acetyltransferase involved in cellulose biosynthesis
MNVQLSPTDTGLPIRKVRADDVHLRVFDNFHEVRQLWGTMEKTGISTVYQSLVWCETWMKRIGVARAVQPLIVIGENSHGHCCFILPLQLRRLHSCRVVEALAAPQTAYAFGLFSPSFLINQGATWFRDHMPDVLAILPAHDLFHLKDTPENVCGFANPIMGANCFSGANQSHVVRLEHSYEAFLAKKRSSDSLRSIRKRDAKLIEAGLVAFDLPLCQHEQRATLAVMFDQQAERLEEFGIHDAYAPIERDFIADLTSTVEGDEPFLRPYRLQLDGKILSVMLGAWYNQTYWALISSLVEGELRRYSPGDFALRSMLKALCEGGAQRLDFSTGDTAYKHHWSDDIIGLSFILRASTLKGLVLAILLLVREKTKRLAKQTPWLHKLLFGLRQKLMGSQH